MAESILGQRIKTLREQRGMSQAALARALGASANAINYLELGSTKAPHIDRLIAIADLFNVSLDYLVGRTDDSRRRGRGKPTGKDADKEEAAWVARGGSRAGIGCWWSSAFSAFLLQFLRIGMTSLVHLSFGQPWLLPMMIGQMEH
jgi:transcriptional regulator with XRE-family HTH domain